MRNLDYPRYGAGLHPHAIHNHSREDFDCSQCEHRHDRQLFTSFDCLRCKLLLVAIFEPQAYKTMLKELNALET